MSPRQPSSTTRSATRTWKVKNSHSEWVDSPVEPLPPALLLDVERLRQAIRWEFHDGHDHPLDDKRATLAAIAVEIGYRTGEPAMVDDVMAEYARLISEPSA